MNPTKSSMHDRLDGLVRYICHSRGRCECGLHCGKGFKVLQWAHIMGRTNFNTRWRLDNCFCLCSGCHWYFTNHLAQFELWSISKIGQSKWDELVLAVNTIKKWTVPDMLELEKSLEKSIGAK